ncbi:MAG: hypothetical protein JJU20_14750 [Opitutales bacterium]|nr:hypothetical protein [Opitutales bacterium]
MKNKQSNSDFFAEIALSENTKSRGKLELPETPKISNLDFSWDENPAQKRRKSKKITNEEELELGLRSLREQYLPFLNNYAPDLEDVRSVMEFSSFDWRIERPEDRKSFSDVLDGLGEWKSVEIPHYGPPLGKAATFYRCTFELPEWYEDYDQCSFCFGGVDYRCQVYLNGICLGSHEGFFECFRLNCDNALKDGVNVLLIRVENDYTMLGHGAGISFPDGDKIYAATGLGYDDPKLGWHHCPPGMGIWNYVRLVGTSRIFIDDLWVRSLLEDREIEVNIEIENLGKNFNESVSFEVSVFGQNFEEVIYLAHEYTASAPFVRGFGDLDHGYNKVTPSLMGGGRNFISFRLPIEDFRVWSPETPWLYQIQVKLFDASDKLLDTRSGQFGMRSFRQDLDSDPKGKFYLNGDEIRLRGANNMGNFERCIMKNDYDGLIDQILLAKLTNMNFLRMTQRPVFKEFYEYCDRLGMMLQTDLPLFATVRRSQFSEVVRQAGCMERHVRGHCSNILVSFINEPRPASASKPHRFINREELENLFEISEQTVHYHNPDRVVKYVDGDYDPPTRSGMPDNHVYCGWYIGHGVDLGALHSGQWLPVKPGWHFGCGEFGAEGLDSYQVMSEDYPDEWKPKGPDEAWCPSVIDLAQSYKFHFLWYPTASTASEWIEASQSHQEWVISMMTKAFRRMKRMNSFAVHLFIDAWPAGWMKSLMDVRCKPKKAWYAYRDALSPVAVFLRCDRNQVFSGESVPVEVWICNDLPRRLKNLSLEFDLEMDGRLVRSAKSSCEADPCSPLCFGATKIQIPHVDQRRDIELGVSLMDAEGNVIHDDSVTFSAFPSPKPLSARVYCPDSDLRAKKFLQSLGAELCTDASMADVICHADYEVFQENRELTERAVKSGATALLLKLPIGNYEFGDKSVRIVKAGMGPRHFVSIATEHPLVAGLEPSDFRFWYHDSKKRVAPILESVIDCPESDPVLLSGNGGWSIPWDYIPAAIEVSDCNGSWRIVQVELIDTLIDNPVAREFSNRLVKISNRTKTFSK